MGRPCQQTEDTTLTSPTCLTFQPCCWHTVEQCAGRMESSLNRADRRDMRSGSELVDFSTPPDDRPLPSLSVYTQSLVHVDEGLKLYLTTVEQGQSLAANCGEAISASYLARQLARLFTTTEPETVRGPQVDWTHVVLSQSSLSRNMEDDTYTLGVSVIRITEVDKDLISSGRPENSSHRGRRQLTFRKSSRP